MIVRLAERDLDTRFGTFKEILFYDGQAESIALVMGDVGDGEHVICRIHSACIGGHIFNSVECKCADEMAAAQAMVAEVGRGVIIYLDQEGKGNGHLALDEKYSVQESGADPGRGLHESGLRSGCQELSAGSGDPCRFESHLGRPDHEQSAKGRRTPACLYKCVRHQIYRRLG